MKVIIDWLANTKILALPRKALGGIINSAIQTKGLVLVDYTDPRRFKVIELANKIKKETTILLGNNEACQIYSAIKQTEKVKGDLAEIGVYKGGSAKLICEAKGERALHLFDTFEGLPEVLKVDKGFAKGQYLASYEEVQEYLKDYRNTYLYKGIFPSTAKPVMNCRFSFVHLDVDIYGSTMACLEFFYPRMSTGGVIISHDYQSAIGVKKAFDEFFVNKVEPVIEMSGSQCLVVKCSMLIGSEL